MGFEFIANIAATIAEKIAGKKKPILAFIFTCILITLAACTSKSQIQDAYNNGYHDGFSQRLENVGYYANELVNNYADLCAESSTGYEDMTGSDAHFAGVICAVDALIVLTGVDAHHEDPPFTSYKLELSRYKEALEMMTDDRDRWLNKIYEINGQNYAEGAGDVDYQIELLLNRNGDDRD